MALEPTADLDRLHGSHPPTVLVNLHPLDPDRYPCVLVGPHLYPVLASGAFVLENIAFFLKLFMDSHPASPPFS